MVISILAPYGERLIKQLILKFQFPQFQFTSPYRERRNNIHHDFDQKAVSIRRSHAGATKMVALPDGRQVHFDSRSLVRSDHIDAFIFLL